MSNSQTVIASEAKQSILPLRGEMDCFAALAMTANTRSRPRRPMRPSRIPPKEGVGNAGCPWHPQPRVRFALVKSTRVNEYPGITRRSEEHTSELQSQFHLVCRLLL